MNPIVMDRIKTLDYLKNKINNKERIVVSRYNDGEYLLMTKRKDVARTTFEDMSDLLKKSIKVKGQLVCVNYPKPHNIKKKDVWFLSNEYLIKEGEQKIYGCGNYSNYDFSNDNILIPKFFKGKVLIVGGLADQAKEFFNKIQPDIDFYKTSSSNVVFDYEYIEDKLLKICNNYDTILFSCGPLSKILVADFIDECDCNLIDLGSVLNAILYLKNEWPMSWVKEINLEKQIQKFFNNLKKEI
jgi:hypothetical protein